jgi:hypothetical protein
MSSVEALAADALPPVEGKVLVALAVPVGGTLIDVSSIIGRFVVLQNCSATANVGYLFGDASTVASLAAGAGVTRCMMLGPLETQEFHIPNNCTFTRSGVTIAVSRLHVVASVGTADVRLAVS